MYKANFINTVFFIFLKKLWAHSKEKDNNNNGKCVLYLEKQ